MTTVKFTQLPTEYPPHGIDAEWRHYRLEPGGPLPEYVVVTAFDVNGSETCVHAADENGDVTDWANLIGSFSGDLDHERALRQAGYVPE